MQRRSIAGAALELLLVDHGARDDHRPHLVLEVGVAEEVAGRDRRVAGRRAVVRRIIEGERGLPLVEHEAMPVVVAAVAEGDAGRGQHDCRDRDDERGAGD